MKGDGGAVMWNRLLLALDQYESGQSALRLTASLAQSTQSQVRVLHIRGLSKWARVPPLETPSQAEDLVREAVFSLHLAGVDAEGHACSVFEDHVAPRIVQESMYWLCDAIILGTRRLHGVERLSGRGVRERIIRLSPLPVIAAPTPLSNAVHVPVGPGTAGPGPANRRDAHSGDTN
jgi:nucleotide-binding universal stress UspA family protein